jgi:hypothetical protein
LQKSMSEAAQQPRDNSNTVVSSSSSSNHSHQDLATPPTPIMAPPVVHPLPLLGTPGAPPAFDGRNVTSFLKKYESMCDNFGIQAETKARRVPEYCEDEIARYLEVYDAWKEPNWEALKTEMLKEWRKEDKEQLMYTRPLLEEYVAKERERDGLKQYYRQFDRISKALRGKDELDAYSQGRLFVLGLPEEIRKRVLSKDDIGPEAETGTVDYEKALRIVKSIVAADERMESFFMRPERRSEISSLASSMNEPKPAMGRESAKGVNSSGGAKLQQDAQVDTVTALAKSFEALTLPLTTAISKLEAAATRPSERPPNGPQGARLDPALDRRPARGGGYGQYGQQRERRPLICYMCGDEGHTLNQCEHTKRLAAEGKMHLNQENRPCLGPMREGEVFPVIKQPNMTMMETIEKLWKMRDPNPPAAVNFIDFDLGDDDSDLEEEDIVRQPVSAEAFAARADVRQRKRSPTRRDVTDPVKDTRHRATKQILQRQEKYPVMKSPRTGTYVPPEGESSETVQEPQREATVENEEPMDNVVIVQPPAPAKTTKEKVPKTSVKKILAGHADPKGLIERMLQQTTSITWAELIGLSPDLRRFLFGSFDDPKASVNQPVEVQASSVSARIEVEDECPSDTQEYDDSPPRLLYIAGSPTAKVQINGHEVTALLDTGAEVSVMSYELARKLQLPITHTFSVSMAGATGRARRFLGLCEDVPIDINKIVYKVPIWVIHRLEHSLVLGRPYHRLTHLKIREMRGGGTEATIYTPDGTGQVSWVAAQPQEERDQTKEDLLQRQALNYPAGP